MNCYTEAALRRRPELLNHAREEITQHAPEGAPPNCMFADVRGGWPSRGRVAELFHQEGYSRRPWTYRTVRCDRCADWADHYFDFIGGRVWSGIACGRVAVQSKLGWILCGQTRSKPSTELIAFLTRVEQLAKETV
ncbi:hypothetical protein T11_6712 [Trichinella zimbabwensis]|uniref:Uncharacterized protein n=1 Tax=Trichinella zimbabwensis TaxID=268475 RepID=A0A0V1H4G5_9BILA|nr:hypothetical protein T11_6712 [Trichinella zimbabwensis]